jgi:hypothetical protein
VADLTAAPAPRRERRPLGLDKGRLDVPPSFFEPLPDDLLDAFEAGAVFPGTPKPRRRQRRVKSAVRRRRSR